MSYHFIKDYEKCTSSQEREAACLRESFSDMFQCAPSSWKNTLGMSSYNASETESYPGSPCGIISVHSMLGHGEDTSMLLQEAFLAKTSVQPEKEQESKGLEVDSGERWQGWFAKFDLATSSWRTPQCSLFGESGELLETWPNWGTTRGLELYPLPMPALHISESESGSWPTPSSSYAVGSTGGGQDIGPQKRSKTTWPTPTADDANNVTRKSGQFQSLTRTVNER